MSRRRIAVVGAGIAGLTAGAALRRTGVEATLLEGAEALRSGGGALWLWANALKALEAIGLARAVVEAGTVVRHYDVRTWKGELLWRFPIDRFAQRYGVPVLFLRRSDLVGILAGAIAPGSIRYGVTTRGFRADRDRVELRLAEGVGRPGANRYDGLLGADGLHSAVRTQLLGERRPRSAGQVAWTGVAELPGHRWRLPPGRMVTYVGGGTRFTAGTGDGGGDRREVFWYSTENASRPGRLLHPGALADLYRVHRPEIAAVVESTPRPIRFWIRDRRPARRWGRGPVTLVGDAAHPSVPDIAQGACQAIEGAVVVARWLDQIPDVPRAFRGYERERMGRTARITRSSLAMNRMVKTDLPGMDLVRNAGLSTWIRPFLEREYRFILDYTP